MVYSYSQTCSEIVETIFEKHFLPTRICLPKSTVSGALHGCGDSGHVLGCTRLYMSRPCHRCQYGRTNGHYVHATRSEYDNNKKHISPNWRPPESGVECALVPRFCPILKPVFSANCGVRELYYKR